MDSKRCAIYARVSTRDQNPENQLRELRAYARRRRFQVAHELIDRESGAKPDRSGLRSLMDLARRRDIDVVLVWKFDRFARSTRQLVNALEEFHGLGVDFVSLTESVDTTTPQGKLLFSIFSAIAEFERSLIRERIKAGLDRARAEGKKLGRPALHSALVEKIQRLRAEGLGVRETARRIQVDPATVSKYSRHHSIRSR